MGPFGCSSDAAQQQMALNFELVVSDQLFSVVIAAYTPGVGRRHMWQLDLVFSKGCLSGAPLESLWYEINTQGISFYN